MSDTSPSFRQIKLLGVVAEGGGDWDARRIANMIRAVTILKFLSPTCTSPSNLRSTEGYSGALIINSLVKSQNEIWTRWL